MTKIVNSLEDLGKDITEIKKSLGEMGHTIKLIWFFLTSPRIQQVIDMNQFEPKKGSELAKQVDLEKAHKEEKKEK
jgi:hypothetical protein